METIWLKEFQSREIELESVHNSKVDKSLMATQHLPRMKQHSVSAMIARVSHRC